MSAAAALLAERGYSLIEMLTVLVIMGVVMASLTTVFVQASNSETDMNNRFQAQLTARLALDKVRREVHCASVVDARRASSSSVTLTLPVVLQDRQRLDHLVHAQQRHEPLRALPRRRRDLHRRRQVGRLPRPELDRDGLQRRALHLQLHGPVDDVAGQAARRLPRERQALEDRRAIRADGRHRPAQQHPHLSESLVRGTYRRRRCADALTMRRWLCVRDVCGASAEWH